MRLSYTRHILVLNMGYTPVKSFLLDPCFKTENIEIFQKACPIDFDDPILELVPENYLDQSPPTDEEVKVGIERVIRGAVAFMVKAGKEDVHANT